MGKYQRRKCCLCLFELLKDGQEIDPKKKNGINSFIEDYVRIRAVVKIPFIICSPNSIFIHLLSVGNLTKKYRQIGEATNTGNDFCYWSNGSSKCVCGEIFQ